MKRIRFIAVLVLLIGFALSCEVEPPIPPCERDNVGTVTVENRTGRNIWTDVTWGNVVENYEKLLYVGGSYQYNNIPASTRLEIWISLDGYDWYWYQERVITILPCEDMTFTWKSAYRKSTACPFVLVLPNGEEIIPILKVKE